MNITTVQLLLLYFVFIHQSKASNNKKYSEIKDSAKQFYQKYFTKDKSWQFLGNDPSKYPGTDFKYREENQKKWDKYYQCLREQKLNVGPHGTPVPEAVQRFEGGIVKFDCKMCLSPYEYERIDSIEWYFGQTDKHYLEQIFFDEHIMMSPKTKALHIYNLREEHTGQYACVLGDSVTVPYYITVCSNGTSKLQEVHSEQASKGPYALQPETIKKYNLVVDTEWSDWSPCSACNKVGKRHRIGYCTVRYHDVKYTTGSKRNALLQEFKQALFNDTHHLNQGKKLEKHDKEKHHNVTAVHLELVKIFVYGIPCNSHILPKSIKHLPQVKKRPNEIMVGYCKQPCPSKELFQVKDKNGKVIETANNSAGIYSMVQGPPPINPPVERRLQYGEKDGKISIRCPGNLNSDVPVHWQVDSKNIVSELIAQESKGRIYISMLDIVHIKKAKVSDSKLYSCWQNDELAGTVRLVVEKRIKLNFNHHLMLIGMLVILGVFVFVFIRAFFKRKYAKQAGK